MKLVPANQSSGQSPKQSPTVFKLLSCLAATALLGACGGGGSSPGSAPVGTTPTTPTDPGTATPLQYDVNVRRTTMGVPHIKADDYGSIGYGMGYAYAEDNVCVLMEDIVSIRGERAKFFGRNGSNYRIIANGASADPIDNDFFWKHVVTDAKIAETKAAQPQVVDDTLTGYAAGFNRYIRELKADQHAGRHAACRDENWLFEISLNDMYRRIIRLGILASSSVFIEGVANAQPPVGGDSSGGVAFPAGLGDGLPVGSSAAAPRSATAGNDSGVPQSLEQALDFFINPDRPLGSNMYSFSDRITATGRPYQFVNPHFPWDGPERLWLMHIMHPETNIHGVSLHGAPAVLIGFNDNLAWSHTVSTAFRFTFFELTMAGPTTYTLDNQPTDLEAVEITVDVLEDDGTITQSTRTLYNSVYGPMVVIADDILDWGASKAYTLRDANIENTRLLEHFFDWNKAENLQEFEQIQRNSVAVPWVNTTAVGNTGDAYYSDQTTVPNVPDSHVMTCNSGVSHQAVQALVPGLPVLDGSRSACNWLTDADAPAPGVFGANNLPSQIREDWVTNCNNSYWLTNPDEPITGFARIIGDEEAERSYRTRQCIRQAQELEDLPDEEFTLEKLQEVVLASRIYTAENEQQAVIDGICNSDSITAIGGYAQGSTVDISTACDVLGDWTSRNNLGDVGGHIWRQFFRELGSVSTPIFSTPFSASDAANTPSGLVTNNPDVRDAFAGAVQRLSDNNAPLDSPIRDIQYDFDKDGNRIPIFGGAGTDGSFTIISFERSVPNEEGYGRANFGNSIVNTITWNDEGVEAYGFLTYSQSTDPASPFFSNLTQRYSDKDWYRWPFTEAEIEAAKISDIQLSE